MYHYANPHSFEVRSTPFQGGLAAGGASSFLPQPWPPLGPGILEANLMMLAAAAPGGWLAGIVPAMLNATMTPAFRGFPPVMQAALPLSQATMDPHGAVLFASALNEFGITDLIVAEGHVPGPLLASLREPGGSLSWQMPGPDGQPLTATFYRVDVPTDDGSWLVQADVSCGGRTVSSQLVRAHEVIADARHPQAFRDGVARGHASWMHHAGEGQDARMAVVCDDGAGRSGTAAVLLRQMSHQQAHEFSGRPGATVPSDELRWADNEFIGEGARRRGSSFAADSAVYLNDVHRRRTERPLDIPDERAGARPSPPEALPLGPFSSTQRRMQSFDDDFSDSDASSQSSDPGLDESVPDAARWDERLRDFDEDAPPPSWRADAASRVQDRPPSRRVASPGSDWQFSQRPPLSPHVLKQIQAERTAIQERQLDRLSNAPRTPLPALDNNAKIQRARAEAAALERALTQARKDVMPSPRRATQPQPDESATEVSDESWDLLASLSDVALPEIERPGAAPVPKPSMAAAASGARMTRSASAPQFQVGTRPVPGEAITRTASEPDLRFATLPGLDRQLAPAARHLVGGLLGERVRATGWGALLQRATGRSQQASLQTRLENDLQPIVEKLRAEFAARAQQKQTGGLAEQEFVVSHLSRHLVDAMSARSDAERLRMFKAIDGGSDEWLDAMDRRDDLLERLKDVAGMPQAKYAQTRDGYRSLDYGIEAVQRANGLLWAESSVGGGGGVNPRAALPAA